MKRGIHIHALIIRALITVTAFLWLSSAAWATFGRVNIVVQDEDGKPVKGVEVTATTAGLENFSEQKITNKKGRATFSFSNATLTYNFHLEYENYPPVDVPIRPQLEDSVTRVITLSRGQTQPVVEDGDAGGGETRVVYTAAEEIFNQGVRALQGGDLDTAQAKFSEALEKDGKMTAAHSALAGVYLEKGMAQEALASADQYLALEPDAPQGLRMRYEALSGLDRKDEAEEVLSKLKKLDKGGNTVKYLYNEGVAATKTGDLATAKARFEEALALDPTLQPALSALGIVYMKEENYAAAASTAEKLLELDSENAQALQIRFDAYRGLGDAAKAKEAMTALAGADPTALIGEFFNTGVRQFEGGDMTAARASFEQVLELDPDHPRANYQLGIVLVSSDPAAAKRHLQKFVELAPDDDPELGTARDMLQYIE